MRTPHRPLILLTKPAAAVDDVAEVPPKRPDPAVPLVLAAFCLGVVVAAAAALGLQISAGDTVPADTHRDTVAQLAAARAVDDAQRARINDQGAALDAGEALTRRLVDALGSSRVTAAQLAALRTSVARQTRIVERTRVVPGPPVLIPAPASAASGRPVGAVPGAARPTPPAAPGTPTPACVLMVLGLCLSRS